MNGTVLFDGQVQGYGKVVMIRDKDGCVSVYGRVKSITVKQGDQVRKGQAIAVMGTTDVSPRVHFEIRKNGKPILLQCSKSAKLEVRKIHGTS